MDKYIDKNLDCCNVCGMGGKLICCETCPKSFHRYCLSNKEKSKLNKSTIWKCSTCISGKQEFSLNIIDIASSIKIIGALSPSSPNSITLGQILLTIECKVSTFTQTKIPLLVSNYFSKFGTSEMPISNRLQFKLLLLNIRNILGEGVFDEVCDDILNKNDSCSVALAPSIAFLTKGCFICKSTRYFHTFCHMCGYIHNINEEFEIPNYTDLIDNLNPSKNDIASLLNEVIEDKIESVSEEGSHKNNEAVEASSLNQSNVENETPISLNTKLTPVSKVTKRLLCAKNGIDYFHACWKKAHTSGVDSHGGDMLFLMRNIAADTVLGTHKNLSSGYFKEMVIGWIKNFSFDFQYEDTDVLLNIMEGLHAVNQLLRPDSLLSGLFSGSANSIPSTATTTTTNTTNPEEVSDMETKQSLETSLSSPTDELAHSIEVNTSGIPQRKSLKRNRTEERSDSELLGSPLHFPSQFDSISFDFNRAKAIVKKVLLSFHISDLMGYDPTDHQVPLTPRSHCSNCGKDYVIKKASHNNKNASSSSSDKKKRATEYIEETKNSDLIKCSECNHILKMKVDYGALTDALVWAYVFEDVGIDISCNNCSTTLAEICSILPVARCYQRIDELGHNFYKLQCYFLTHLIYVFSDWGQHALRRQLFAEEFEFIVKNMKVAIKLGDHEITSEFIQCLKILQVTEKSDPEIWKLVLMGYDFLIEKEIIKGGKGRWVAEKDSLYDRYHSSYCCSIALLDYYFMEDDNLRLNPPLPRLVTYLKHKS